MDLPFHFPNTFRVQTLLFPAKMRELASREIMQLLEVTSYKVYEPPGLCNPTAHACVPCWTVRAREEICGMRVVWGQCLINFVTANSWSMYAKNSLDPEGRGCTGYVSSTWLGITWMFNICSLCIYKITINYCPIPIRYQLAIYNSLVIY